MRKLLAAASVVAVTLGFAITPAWAPHGCSGGCPNIQQPGTAAVPPPAADKCKTDAALKQKCTAAYNSCVRLAAAHPKCKEHLATCCTAP
jgi:hypothetical protein